MMWFQLVAGSVLIGFVSAKTFKPPVSFLFSFIGGGLWAQIVVRLYA